MRPKLTTLIAVAVLFGATLFVIHGELGNSDEVIGTLSERIKVGMTTEQLQSLIEAGKREGLVVGWQGPRGVTLQPDTPGLMYNNRFLCISLESGVVVGWEIHNCDGQLIATDGRPHRRE